MADESGIAEETSTVRLYDINMKTSWHYVAVAVVLSTNLNHAICLAVAEAITGNKYELED